MICLDASLGLASAWPWTRLRRRPPGFARRGTKRKLIPVVRAEALSPGERAQQHGITID